MARALAATWIVKSQLWTVEAGQAAVNTFYYKTISVGVTPATDQDLADTIGTNCGVPYRALLNGNATYKGVVCQIIIPPPIAVDVVSVINAGAGSAGAPALPKQVSGIISWYTALAGKNMRGRSYIPFPAVPDDLGDGTPTAAYVTRLDALVTALRGVTNVAIGGRTATVSIQLYHRATTLSDAIVSTISRQQWATQRRRGAYGRPNSSPV